MLVAGGLALAVLCGAGIALLTVVVRDRISDVPSGSTTITVEAIAPVADDALERTRRALAGRAEAAGLADPSVQRSGDRRIVVRVAGAHQEEKLRALVAVGELEFRRVLATTTQRPDASAAGTPPVPGPQTAPPPSRDQVITKLGRAYEVAQSLVRDRPAPEQIDPVTREALTPFAALSGAEVAVLPPEVGYVVSTVTCAQLLARPVDVVTAPGEWTATCDRAEPPSRYLLDSAAVSAADISKATATLETHGQWVVTIGFTSVGQQRFTELTRTASGAGDGANQVAIVVDDVVVSAPTIQTVLTGDAQIVGNFTRSTAEALVSQLRSGPLPVALRVVDLTSDPG
ncbi:hypothetical protein AAH979_30075 [Plantactinospora sp. ZYX-F-223]|uniref:SecDF P1 head subdomain-containing protein n=1 Tax=Plantactinospora sp. ZYX-F-223 TaxID=3144103 RepID=UPI0031FC134E